MNTTLLRRAPQLSTLLSCNFGGKCARFEAASPSYRLLLKPHVPTFVRFPTNVFSSKSAATDDDRIRNDPEVRAWMEQLSQHFGEPLASRTDFTSQDDGDTDRALSTKDEAVDDFEEKALRSVSAPYAEIEDFGYHEYEDEEEVEERNQPVEAPISLERGEAGVFDLEEVVTVLEEQNGVDIQVLDIPPEARFVDHMIIVSGKSIRHMHAMASAIHWLYNRKRRKGDKPFRLEGKDCNNWLAMDLGNVAVHIFMPQARQHYDLETLWTLGPEHDDERHYVQDEHVNLTAAELFWLESGMNQPSEMQNPDKKDSVNTMNMQDGQTGSKASTASHKDESAHLD